MPPWPELEPYEDARAELLPDDLSAEARSLLDREELAWAGKVLNGRKR